jgi:hypothetical protein
MRPCDRLENRNAMLHGKPLVVICAHCERIQDERGDWRYVKKPALMKAQTLLSHGLCEECAHELYPDVFPANWQTTLARGRLNAMYLPPDSLARV